MTAAALIETFQSRGLSIRADGDSIKVSPSSALTDDDRQAIRSHKAGLLDLLSRRSQSDSLLSIEIEGASPPAPEGSTPVITIRSYEVARILEDIDRKLTAIKNTEQTNQAAEVG